MEDENCNPEVTKSFCWIIGEDPDSTEEYQEQVYSEDDYVGWF